NAGRGAKPSPAPRERGDRSRLRPVGEGLWVVTPSPALRPRPRAPSPAVRERRSKRHFRRNTNIHGDTQWYFPTTFASAPSDTDHASKSIANLFSNQNLSAQGASHLVDAYLEKSCSGPSLTDGLPNRTTTEVAV